jgi:prepilin-type N-terminal cleavage/methylation domain-containing protein
MNFDSTPKNYKTHGMPSREGFTLLEMLVALSAFVFLMGGIFAIAQGTLELSNDIGQAQENSQIRQNFIEFLRRSFRSLPGEAEVRLSVRAKGGTYVPTLNFVNGGSSFTPGTSLPPDTSIDLYAEERPGGYLRVMVRVLDEKQTQALRSNQNVRYSRDQITMPLLDNVSRFEWRFFDASTNRWENNWKQGRRPLLAEMNLQLDDGFETRAVFWLPPIVPNAVNMVGAPGVPSGVPGGPLNPNDPNSLNLPDSLSPLPPK